MCYLKSYSSSAKYKDMKRDKVLKEYVRIYGQAFGKMESNEKKIELTDLFLDHVFNLNLDKPYGSELISEFMEMAHNTRLLSERHYMSWLRLCDEDNEIASLILKKSIETNPKSVKLWKLRLHFEICRDPPVKDVETIFGEGVAQLKEKSLPLWDALLRYEMFEDSMKSCESFKTVAIFQSAITQPPEISVPFKKKFLEWALIHR